MKISIYGLFQDTGSWHVGVLSPSASAVSAVGNLMWIWDIGISKVLVTLLKRRPGHLCDTFVLPVRLRHIFGDSTTIPEALEVYFTYPWQQHSQHLKRRWHQKANHGLPLYQSYHPIPRALTIASFWPKIRFSDLIKNSRYTRSSRRLTSIKCLKDSIWVNGQNRSLLTTE